MQNERILEIAQEVAAKVKEQLNDIGYEVETNVNENLKTNDIKLVSISIMENASISPVIHMNRIAEDIESGKLTIEDAVDRCINIYKDTTEDTRELNEMTKEYLTKEFVLDQVQPLLIGTEFNKELLEKMVSRPFVDMSIIYQNVVKIDESGMHSIKVSKDLAETVDLTEEELHEAAMNNLRKKEPKIQTMVEVMKSFMMGASFPEEEVDEIAEDMDAGLWLVTNDIAVNGSNQMLKTEVLDELHEKVGDYYILPSSLHEFLAVPKSCAQDVADLKEMVTSINRDTVNREDWLSDSVYEYDAEAKEVRIAA